MSASLHLTDTSDAPGFEQAGDRMSILEHLDELRRRLIRSSVFVFLALAGCWFVSDRVYNFLAVPIKTALAETQREQLPAMGFGGSPAAQPLAALPEGAAVRYTFAEATRLGGRVIPPGASVLARVARDGGRRVLLTDESLVVGDVVLPGGTLLPPDFDAAPGAAQSGADDRLIVNTAMEPFSLYLKVSLYAALCLSVPFLLWQVWGFISPGLYAHERGWALPFVLMSSASFVAGAAFAYYVLFPPAVAYLLGLGSEFRLFLNASDYFDFVIIVLLA